MALPLLPTSLVGSYAQPDWLIDRQKLAGRFPPRVRAKELWRVAPEFLDQAQDDATLLAIRDQERAGLDCRILETLPGKTIILGVLDLSTMAIEHPETVAARIRRALPYVPADRIVVAPDCGLKYLPRDVAYGKMCAMVEGAKIVRAELAGSKIAS
jgi:methionine synthase II (cobalamin-independent)